MSRESVRTFHSFRLSLFIQEKARAQEPGRIRAGRKVFNLGRPCETGDFLQGSLIHSLALKHGSLSLPKRKKESRSNTGTACENGYQQKQ